VASVAQDAARLDEVRKALLLLELSDREDDRRAGSPVRRWREAVDVDTVVDAQDLRVGVLSDRGRQMVRVVPGAGHHEFGGGQLLGEQHRIDVDVVGVGGGAEREIEEPPRDERDRRRPVDEVRVQMAVAPARPQHVCDMYALTEVQQGLDATPHAAVRACQQVRQRAPERRRPVQHEPQMAARQRDGRDRKHVPDVTDPPPLPG
jgi:hypothetical protein